MNTLEGAQVINTKEIDAISGDLHQIAHAVAADELITMTVTPGPSTFAVEISRLSGEEIHLLWATRIEVPADNLRLLAETIAANLESAYPQRKRRPGAFHVTAPDLSWPDTLADLRRIRKSAPELLNAAVLEASVARFLFEMTNDHAYLKQAYEAVDAAKRVAPADFRTLLAEAEVAVAADDHQRAQTTLDDLERIEPANIAAAQQRARLAEKMGRAEEARTILTTIATRAPSWKNLLNLAKIESFLGDSDAARTHLAEADRRTPSTLLIMTERAHLELMSGKPEQAEALFLQIVAMAPEAQNLTNLATSQLLLHRYEEALMNFDRAYSMGSRSPLGMLNMADCHLLLGHQNRAQEGYNRALAAQPKNRPLLAGELEIRAQALAQLGRNDEALQAIQEALSLDADSPYVLYAAALVYSIVDKPDEARRYNRAALKAGINAQWFDLPWFAGILPDGPSLEHSPSPQTSDLERQ